MATRQVNVMDVAEYILRERGTMTTGKLQKLCYYAQAWSLVWDDAPLFEEPIQAWANGPVVPALYKWHRGQYRVSGTPDGDPRVLSQDQKETIDAVSAFYGDMSTGELTRLTHLEEPWAETRWLAGLGPGQRGDIEIPLDAIVDYYSGLYDAAEA